MRKVFLSTMTMIENPTPYLYKDKELAMEKLETAYPIKNLINHCSHDGDDIVVITVVAKNDTQKTYAEENYEKFCVEVRQLLSSRKLKWSFIEIPMSNFSKSDSHRELFINIVEKLSNGDEIYTDITYGFKSTPIVMFSALNYVYKTKNNVDIRNIIYGNLYNGTKDLNPEIFDITSLFYINSLAGLVGNVDTGETNGMLDFILNKSGR